MAMPEKRLRLQEFLPLPEDEPQLEYKDGMEIQNVSPQGYHLTNGTLRARIYSHDANDSAARRPI